MKEELRKAADLIASSQYAIALTGAGISTESGIPDFRSPGGLWSRFDPDEFASISSFMRDPAKFYQMAGEFASLFSAEPNEGHKALAELEQMGLLKTIVTQNIDGLHQAAGSKNVIEVHGNVRESKCMWCERIYPILNLAEKVYQMGEVPPRCDECGGVLKPNVVFFGEQLPREALDSAFEHARKCDLILVAGSSLVVSPANLLPEIALGSGAKLIIVNDEETHMDKFASVVLRGKTGEILPKIIESVQSIIRNLRFFI